MNIYKRKHREHRTKRVPSALYPFTLHCFFSGKYTLCPLIITMLENNLLKYSLPGNMSGSEVWLVSLAALFKEYRFHRLPPHCIFTSLANRMLRQSLSYKNAACDKKSKTLGGENCAKLHLHWS
jgi:hypothetical protein